VQGGSFLTQRNPDAELADALDRDVSWERSRSDSHQLHVITHALQSFGHGIIKIRAPKKPTF
jgi:hypothetical protein